MAERSIKKNYIFNLASRIVSILVPLFIVPFVARRLGPEGVGLCSYIASIVSYFTLFAHLGVESYALREIAMHRDDEDYKKKFLIEVTIFKVITTVTCLAAYYIMFLVFLGGENKLLYLIYSLSLIQIAIDFTWYFQGIEKFNILAVISIITRIAYVPLVLLLVQDIGDLWIYALITAGTGLVNAVLYIPFLLKNVKGKIEGKINPFRHLKPCMVYFLPTIASTIYTVVDKTMIGLITKSTVENGFYEEADRIVKIPMTVLYSINAIMQSRISYYYAKDNIDAIKSLTIKSANFSFMVAFPMCFGIVAVARTFVPLYLGEDFARTTTLLYILAALIPIISVSNMLGSHYYTPMGKRKQSALYLVIGAAVNVSLNSFMIYLWGAVGAAIASVISELTITVLYVIFARKLYPFMSYFKYVLKYFIAAAVMGVAVFFMNYCLPANVGFLILEIATGVVMYIAILLALRTEFFIENMKSMFGHIKRLFVRKKPDPAVAADGAVSGDAPLESAEAAPEPPPSEISAADTIEQAIDANAAVEDSSGPERDDAGDIKGTEESCECDD